MIIYPIITKEIILSSGVGKWSTDELWNQYKAYKLYSEIGMITTASILVYHLTDNGTMGVYETNVTEINAEDYQLLIKKDFNLKALPCLYCDATIGACANLSYKLEKIYLRENEFIQESIIKAQKYGWDGYSVDFEPDTPIDSQKITTFVLNWANKLNKNGMRLSIWIGGPTQYIMNQLYNSSIINLITMETYNQNYEQFIETTTRLEIASVNLSNIGLGMLTYAQGSSKGNVILNENNDLLNITNWLKIAKIEILSIWASTIPPSWYIGLMNFIR